MIKKYNISKPEKYNKDGQEKTFWTNIGTMTEFTKEDGSISRMLEIPAISLKANIFPVEPKVQREIKQINNIPVVKYGEGEVDPKDIPF